jgi:replicative DNA helicase Mcm
VPVTFRTLEGVVRVAEAATKFEFSETIDERHVEIATELVGQSMQDIGRDAEGRFDADVHETGRSKSQKDRKNALVEVLEEAQQEYEDGVPREQVVETMVQAGYEGQRVENDIRSLLDAGEAVEPQGGRVRYIGRF